MMKRLLPFLALLLAPSFAFGAIAVDKQSLGSSCGANCTSLSWSMTSTSSAAAQFVCVGTTGQTVTYTSVTDNGVAMTRAASSSESSNVVGLYWDTNSTTTIHNFILTQGNSGNNTTESMTVSYTGMNSTVDNQGSKTLGTTATTFAEVLTATSSSVYAVWCLGNSNGAITAGSQTRVLVNSGATALSFSDSNQMSTTTNWGFNASVGVAGRWAGTMVTITIAAAAANFFDANAAWWQLFL